MTMTIKQLGKMSTDSGTWQWRTVEGNTGVYFTFGNGKGIHFYRDDHQFGCKVCTAEKFSVCKTVPETEQKLNQMFADREADPTPENQWRF